MTPAELEDLSRAAAAKLPPEFAAHLWPSCVNDEPSGIWTNGTYDDMWLHESTEACAEIMVRVLWPKGWLPVGHEIGCYVLNEGFLPTGIAVRYKEIEGGPMLVFRVAVLRAVVAL